MARKFRLTVTCAVFAAFSCASEAWSLCLPEGSNPVGDMSFHGGNAAVYGTFSGCGQRTQKTWAHSRVRVSYAKTADAKPFAGIDGQSFHGEEFLDAELKSAVGPFASAGVTASVHTLDSNEDATQKRTAGGGFWLSDPDNRFAFSSAVAVNGDNTVPARSLAHHHRLALSQLDFGAHSLSAVLSFSETDPGYQADRSTLDADRRVASFEGTWRSGGADLTATYLKARDNVANRSDVPTTSWQKFGGRFSWKDIGVPGLPSSFAVRGAIGNQRERSAKDTDTADRMNRDKTWGANARWGESSLFTGLDVGGSMTTRGPDGGGSEQVRKQRMALEMGAEDQGRTLRTAFFTEDETTDRERNEDGPRDVGWSFSVDVPGHSLESSVACRTDAAQERQTPWKWTIGAKVDALRILGGSESARNWFMLAEVNTEVENNSQGTQADFRAMLSSGLRF